MSRELSPAIAPLSYGQRAMWFMWSLHPDGVEYNLPMAWAIKAKLDVPAVHRTFQRLVDRHAILRTTYTVQNGQPVQLIHGQSSVWFEAVSAAAWDDRALQEYLSRAVHQPFDLKNGPVFRVHLLTRAEKDHILLFNFHHITCDGWTLAIMLEDFSAIYREEATGKPASLTTVSSLYADLAHWQEAMLNSPAGETHWQYWQAQLSQLPTLDLPTDRPRPPVQTYDGKTYPFEFDRAFTQQLRALAKQEGVTLNTVLLAAFYVLLYRYSGQDDLVVGSPRYGRPPEGYDWTVGYFSSPCALRVQVDAGMRFVDFLTRVREVLVESKNHQDFPFPLLVEKLAIPRDPSRTPVFQVSFTYQKAHLAHMQGVTTAHMGLGAVQIDLAGLQMESYPLEYQMAKFDLDIMVEEIDGVLRGIFWYNTNLWDQETIVRMVSHYQTLLSSAVAQPEQLIGLLPLLTAREQQQILVAWNNTKAEFPQEKRVYQLFEEQAERTPGAVAISFGATQLTYYELNQRANQLAHYLRKLGVERERLIGISIERCPELIVAVLGVMKSGAAYVPLDPAYPRDRLAYMLDDAKVQILLTQQHLLEVLPLAGASGANAIRSICLDVDWPAIAQQPDDHLNAVGTSQDLAYVMYTSGSTGRPKGVMIEHGGLTNLVVAELAALGLGPGNRVLQFAAFSFDVSLWDIFGAIGSGATLCMAPRAGLMPGSDLVNTLRAERVDAVCLPASVLALLNPDNVPGVKVVSTIGEAVSSDIVARWAPGRRFVNAYGPTEITVISTTAECTAGQRVTIGRSIANMTAYVLDKQLQPTPIGVVGELYIGGVGVARGYMNRPDLTAERFIQNPFGAPGERIYKTGDLVRYLPSGDLEYLGRVDHQVKIRGFRVELGEIEAVIRDHAAVQDALVMASLDSAGFKQLVGYVIPMPGSTLTTADLRTHIKEKLPEFMVPGAFVFLLAWPLTPNGKIDRRALPAPTEVASETVSATPGTDLEKCIAGVWQDVLGVRAVGIDDNFFEIGGHSLAIVKVENRLNQKLDLTISTMDLFRFPTIRALATYLSTKFGTALPTQHQQPSATKRAPADVHGSGRPITGREIAIVGMAGRFPGARNIEAFWENLCNGVESIRELTEEELLEASVDPELLLDPRYVKRKGILDDIEYFDAPFFGYPPREAQLMDPQQRLFLELGWQALEHAGYNGSAFPGPVGVFAGTGPNTYWLHNLSTQPDTAAEGFQTFILNDKDFLATRLAYKLNLRGPALTVQTACSTSLAAVHLACQSLLTGECDMALAGGVSIEVPHITGYQYQDGHIMSPDGHCRAFDASAKGTVRGSGGGIVVLKRLADAQADGDTIWAVIKGTAINNDGMLKVGYTAPSVDGQAEVIMQALDRAEIAPRTIGYVEAHGTGTPLGDPIEVMALTQAYRRSTSDHEYCAIGSAKTNVGHLDTASGVTGLIKATLALHHHVIPPSLHFNQPNPKLDLPNSPFYVNTQRTEWTADGTPRRAAVSSFGIGGTNAHAILEEAPHATRTSTGRPYQLLALSAKTESALANMSANLAAHIRQNPEVNLADAAYTLQIGRAALSHRRIVVCSNAEEAVEGLEKYPRGRAFVGTTSPTRGIIFLFPGQGLQHVNMGRDLYECEPEFRQTVDSCALALQPLLGFDLRTVLYPTPAQSEEAAQRLNQTAVTQPALFVVEYALAKLLMSWGVSPQALMGHSLGEYVAACLAGVFSLEDALTLVAARGQLIQSLPTGGGMLALEMSAEEVKAWLTPELDLAAVNAPKATVVAGPIEALEGLEYRLKTQGINCSRVRTSHAFHSAMLDPILPQFRRLVSRVQLNPPRIPFITNVTGTWITPEQALDPSHWVHHLRGTVQFADGMTQLLQEPGRIYLEVGPGQVFTSTIQRYPGRAHALLATPVLGNPQQQSSDWQALLTALGRTWIAGVSVDWQQLHAGYQRQRIPLPVYPFDRQRYWVEARPQASVHSSPWLTEVAATVDLDQPPLQQRMEAHVISPRDETELELVKIYEGVLGVTPIGVTDGFFDLGGTSLSALTVISRIEQVFGRRIPTATLLEGQTVEALARVLSMNRATGQYELVGIQTTGTLPPVFCIHPYGGHVTGYFQLARLLGPDQPVYGLQARGLHGEAPPHTSMEEMAADYIRVIKSKQPFGPYLLLGHSMGGNIAFEIARQLRQAGEEVALLAMLDSKAENKIPRPIYRDPQYSPIGAMDWLSDEAAILGMHFPDLPVKWEHLRGVPVDEQWLRMLDVAIDAGLLPTGTGYEQFRHVLAVTKANDTILRTYVPGPYDGDVLLLTAEEGFAKQFADTDLGWRGHVAGELKVVPTPGDHFNLVAQPHVEVLADRVQVHLSECYRLLPAYWATRLKALAGRPVRIILADGSVHLGIYHHLQDAGIVDRLSLATPPQDAICVEIITPHGLLRFDSTAHDGSTCQRITFDLPRAATSVQRRRDMRVDVTLPVSIDEDNVSHFGSIVNLSAGGCAIQMDAGWRPPLGQAVALTFANIDHARFAEVPATVIRVEHTHEGSIIGIQFTALSLTQTEALNGYCR